MQEKIEIALLDGSPDNVKSKLASIYNRDSHSSLSYGLCFFPESAYCRLSCHSHDSRNGILFNAIKDQAEKTGGIVGAYNPSVNITVSYKKCGLQIDNRYEQLLNIAEG